MTKLVFVLGLLFLLSTSLLAQELPIDSIKAKIEARNERRDSLYIAHIEDRREA